MFAEPPILAVDTFRENTISTLFPNAGSSRSALRLRSESSKNHGRRRIGCVTQPPGTGGVTVSGRSSISERQRTKTNNYTDGNENKRSDAVSPLLLRYRLAPPVRLVQSHLVLIDNPVHTCVRDRHL